MVSHPAGVSEVGNLDGYNVDSDGFACFLGALVEGYTRDLAFKEITILISRVRRKKVSSYVVFSLCFCFSSSSRSFSLIPNRSLIDSGWASGVAVTVRRDNSLRSGVFTYLVSGLGCFECCDCACLSGTVRCP